MERNYDSLTPSQKARLTRRSNKLWEERNTSEKDFLMRIWDMQREEAENIYKLEETRTKFNNNIKALEEQIEALKAEKKETLDSIWVSINNFCKPAQEKYEAESAREWAEYKVKDAELIETFWQEIEAEEAKPILKAVN